MAKKEITTPTRISTKKKKWCSILSSSEFNNIIIGETFAEFLNNIKGRTVRADLGMLTDNQKKQGFSLKFVITGIDDAGNALTQLKKCEMNQILTKRLARKGKARIEDSFIIECKDAKARIKPFLIAKENLLKSRQAGIRKKVFILISEFCKPKTFSEVITSIISNELQKKIRAETRKIYPLILCEIRVIERLQ
ncbi:hypothetical protein HZB88_05095 [archaeon]|nr:hypothetical protein [archaeon]